MSRPAWSDTLGRDPGPSTLQGALDSIARAGRRPIPIPFWADLKRLPREARDTLFLVAVIGWTVLPPCQVLHRMGRSCCRMSSICLPGRSR